MVFFFKDLQFTVDFTSKHFPYKRKQEIRRNITENGGTISYILNNKVCQSSKIGDVCFFVVQFVVLSPRIWCYFAHNAC